MMRVIRVMGVLGMVLGVMAMMAAARPAASMLAGLAKFTAGDAPALGPGEPGPTPRNWPDPDPAAAPALPGRGIAQHPMLYAGEGYNTTSSSTRGR
jgi:hypothetical protein